MDHFADRVPIRTLGSGTKYDGRVWYKRLSTIRNVNGVDVDRSKPLDKSTLKQGDRVTIEYKNKTYHGKVNAETPPSSECPTNLEPDSAVPPEHTPHQQERQQSSPPQLAGTRVSPRKHQNKMPQDTPPRPPKERKVVPGKRTVAKKAGAETVFFKT